MSPSSRDLRQGIIDTAERREGARLGVGRGGVVGAVLGPGRGAAAAGPLVEEGRSCRR